jgi:hypothetical protein
MPQTIVSNDFVSLMAAAGVASVTAGNFSGPLLNAKVGLFTAPATPTKANVPADFTAPLYTGYARQTLTAFAGPINQADGGAAIVGSLSTFLNNTAGANDTVVGYVVFTSDGTKWLWCEIFDAPVLITNAGDGVPVTPALEFPPVGWGNARVAA